MIFAKLNNSSTTTSNHLTRPSNLDNQVYQLLHQEYNHNATYGLKKHKKNE
jgi:hypothetical protein